MQFAAETAAIERNNQGYVMNDKTWLDKPLETDMRAEELDARQENATGSAAQQKVPNAADAAETDSTAEKDEATEQEHSWGSLPAERHQLIRLSPLPANRETGLRPLLFGTLGRVSRHSDSLSMLRLTVELTNQKSDKGLNELEVWADHEKKEIRFLPEEGLRTEPGNRGIGRFMIALAARWVRHKWAHYTVQSTPLLLKHVPTDNARLRRDYALQAQGFTVAYEDGVQMRANCSAPRANQIHTDWNIEKIRIIETNETAEILQSADKNLHEQESQIKKLTERVEFLQRDDNTLRFTITMLVVFAVFQAALLIWMATR